MRVWNVLTFMVVACLAFNSLAFSQAPTAPAAGNQPAASAWPTSRIALIDIGFILRNHPTMKQEQEAVDGQAKAYQDEFVKKRQELVKQAEGLKQFEESSPEYKQKEEQLADAGASLELEMARKEKELIERRAAVIYKNYNEIAQMVKWLAGTQGIDMIVTFNREEMDPKNPATIQRGVAKPVIYHNPQLDLTDWVLNNLKQSAVAPAAAPAAQPAAATANAQGAGRPAANGARVPR